MLRSKSCVRPLGLLLFIRVNNVCYLNCFAGSTPLAPEPDDDGAADHLNGIGHDDDAEDDPLLGQFNMEDHIQERTLGEDVLPAFTRDHYPPFETLVSWIEKQTERIDEEASPNLNTSSSPGQSSIKLHKDTIGPNAGRYPDPFHVPGHVEPFKLFKNVRQRSILTAVVRFLKTLVEWEATDQSTPQPVFRALCCGVAGTGKTFIMQFIRIFTNIVLDHNDATKVLGPTGMSSGNCNGSTVDRALKA